MIDIDKAFTYHPPKDQAQQEKYNTITKGFRLFAELIQALCPESPEKTIALRKLQESRMWANASIAINET